MPNTNNSMNFVQYATGNFIWLISQCRVLFLSSFNGLHAFSEKQL